MAQGDGERGLWSVHHTLPLPLLPPQQEDSSHSAPAPARCPSHRRQSFMNKLPQLLVPHGVTSPVTKPAPVWAALSTGPQVLPGGCS